MNPFLQKPQMGLLYQPLMMNENGGLKKRTPWPESASELYRLSGFSANFLRIEGCRIVSAVDPLQP
jgi:hypothetical protein